MAMGVGAAMLVAGTPDHLVVASPRRRLEKADVDFAKARCAAGWGWQAIAQALRVNRDDLRMAMGDLEPAPPRAPVAVPKVRTPDKRLRRGTQRADMLMLLAAGIRDAERLEALMRLSRKRVYQVAQELARAELIASVTWALTPMGEGEAARLKAEAQADA